MKRIFPLILLLSSFLMNCQSQKDEEFLGEFYMVNKSGFAEFTITNDSVFNKYLFSDFKPKRNKKRSYFVDKQVRLDDRVLLLVKKEKDNDLYTTVMTLTLPNKKKYIKQVINSIDTTATLETIIKLNKNDKRPLVGFNLYSKEQIDSLKLMKPIEGMTLNEFKGFQIALFEKMKVAIPEFSKSSFNGVYGMNSTFNFQMVSQTLLEEGFNPVQTSNSTEALYKKYFNNPEIKELIENLKKEK